MYENEQLYAQKRTTNHFRIFFFLLMNITLKMGKYSACCPNYYLPLQRLSYQEKEDGNVQQKRIIILSAIGILLTSLICLFAFRNVILCHIVDKRTTRAEQTYGLQIHYQELRMKGCNEVALQGLSIVPNQRDTLLTLQSVNVKLSFGNC